MILRCSKNCNLNFILKIFKKRRIRFEIMFDSIISERCLLYKSRIDNEWFEKEGNQCKVQLLSIILTRRIILLVLFLRFEKENNDWPLRIKFQMWKVDWSNQKRIKEHLILKFIRSLSKNYQTLNQQINEWTQISMKQFRNFTIQRIISKQYPMKIESKMKS